MEIWRLIITDQKFFHTSTEQKKEQQGKNFNSDSTVRETPGQQGPGHSGYSKPDYSEWTKKELLEHAQKLALNADEDTSIDRLRELLEQASPLN